MPGSSLWRVAAPHALALRQWENELVVYNDATGHTHLLGSVATKLLRTLLGDGAQSVASLIQYTTPEAESDGPRALAEIEVALTELARHGLVAHDS